MGEWWSEFRGRGVKDALKAAERYAANEAAIDALLAGGGSILHQATMELDHDQIRQLPTIPITVLGAPGGDVVAIPIMATLKVDSSAGAYGVDASDSFIALTWEGTDALYLAINDGTNGSMAVLSAGTVKFVIGYTYLGYSDSYLVVVPPTSPTLSNAANKALQLQATNTGDFTGGNASNSGLLTVEFRVWNSVTGRFLTTAESGWNETTRTFA